MSIDLKKCTACNIEKEINEFPKYVSKDSTIHYRAKCKSCYFPLQKESSRKYREKNKKKISKQKKERYQKNRKKELENAKKYAITHKQKRKEYGIEYGKRNKEKVRLQQNEYKKNRRKNDIIYKLREDFSTIIRRAIKNNGGSKRGKSCINILPYTIKELRSYLESKFEPWMTWKNYGKYNATTWVEDNQNTWTWNIDHIIPQSDLPYKSMNDENFQKCWELKNLRPYSSLQNLLDGTSRARHEDKNVT